MRSWRVFWFSSSGLQITTVDIPLNTVPVPENHTYTTALETVIPDISSMVLYIKVDYYGTNDSSGTGEGYGYVSSAILVLDAETGKYSDMIEIPAHYRESTEPAGFNQDRQKMLSISGKYTGGT